MKIKDLHSLDGSWDVYGNIADEVGIAFVNEGHEWLTEDGRKHFKDVLELNVRVTNKLIMVDTESALSKDDIDNFEFNSYESYPDLVKLLSDLFWSYAGYCSPENWDKWFKKSE